MLRCGVMKRINGFRRFPLKRIFKILGITIACLVVFGSLSVLAYRKYLQHKVAKEGAISSPSGIDSLESVRIGGIDQWIQVRGQNVNNPILLFIHGGPGLGFIPLGRTFQRPWERYFTVVQWDQRGAGKTYASNDRELQRRTMNLPQMEQDTLDIVNYLRHRFQRDKIFVMGHSWGSVLGLWLAHQHPELIFAYVGTGQIVATEQNSALLYHDMLQEARNRHNDEATRELEGIAPYPPPNADIRKLRIVNQWAGALLGPPPRAAENHLESMMQVVVSAPEYSLVDDYEFVRAPEFSAEVLLPQLMSLDMTKLGLDFQVPIFFFEGRHDPYCRPSLVWEYSQNISAPRKGFIWFENAGHFAFFEPQFTEELVRQVRPLAKEPPAPAESLTGRSIHSWRLVTCTLTLASRMSPALSPRDE